MINILNDVHGISGTNLIIPFSLDYSNLQGNVVTVEAIGKIGNKYETLPKGNIFMVKDNDTEEPVDMIHYIDFARVFVLRLNTSAHNVESIYFRIFNKDMSAISPEIFISRDTLLEFSTKPKELEFRPTSITVKDNVHCTYNNAVVGLTRDKFEISIYISNNSTSEQPVWEDVTNDYLNNLPLVFKNTTKDSGKPWTASVKYKIKKINTNSTVQISDIAMLIV